MLLLCALSSLASAQENPLTWLPLQVGHRWTYQHEWKSGDRNRSDVERWTTEETVTGRVTVPEGLVILREVKEQGSSDPSRSAHRGYVVERDRQPYLVRGNCVYVLGEDWDRHRESLLKNAVSADFCFPLQRGNQWGNVDIHWSVEPARAAVASLLPAQYAGAIHLFSGHFGSGGTEDVWFRKGIGVVAEHYIHNGTYDEYTKKLVSFN